MKINFVILVRKMHADKFQRIDFEILSYSQNCTDAKKNVIKIIFDKIKTFSLKRYKTLDILSIIYFFIINNTVIFFTTQF